jgi:tripartite-type tricarboxylate transporter receptor subunit TctC
MMAPAATPPEIVARLAAASAKAVRAPDLAARLVRDGIEPVGGTPGEFAALISRELTQWRELIAAAKISQ